MAGLFGLFGSKTKYVDEPNTASTEQNGNEQGSPYFLESDDAKTYGNIEFMQKSHTIKRSFPKTLKGVGAKVVAQVSSMEKAKFKGNNPVSPNPSVTPVVKSSVETPTRRTADSHLDMFRKMAKEMKK